MQKIKVFIVVLVLVLAVSFSLDGNIASAKTTARKSKVKTSSSKKKAVKKSAAKKHAVKKKSSSKHKVKKAKKSSTKKKNKRKRTSRGRIYSRGSGAALGEGNVIKVINYAKRYLGVHYDFGSSSSKAFDCSGFIMFVYKVAGIDLPHSAAGQANLGLAVDKSDLKPGDLVFFETYKAGISHVGMYIGYGHFIHASSGAGHVTVTSLSDPYYVSRYRGATRILND